MKPPPGFFADAKFNMPILSLRPREARVLEREQAPPMVEFWRMEISVGVVVTYWRGEEDQVDRDESAA